MTRSKSDVSAVVLTVGESTTAEAIRAVEAQTLPVREVVTVEGVSPFHHALNEGAARVQTPYFVQVDADMILDPICVETLRSLFTPSLARVSGFLRDRLLGRVCCIKMFRTAVFADHSVPNTIAQDADFSRQIEAKGWLTLIALRYLPNRDEWHTFGEHRPSYSPHYTFNRFLIEGRRARYRKDTQGFRSRLARLHRQAMQDASLLAQIGLGHGIFLEGDNDMLRPTPESDEFLWLDAFLRDAKEVTNHRGAKLRAAGEAREIFRDAYRFGIELRAARDVPALRVELQALGASSEELAWVAHVGICHGLFAPRYDDETFEDRFRLLSELLD